MVPWPILSGGKHRMSNPDLPQASREEMRRLGLIRYQLTLALRQAEQPHPLDGFSVLGFQDSVESFLHLAAGHLHIDVRGKDFLNYLDDVSARMPDGRPLGYRTQLVALNQARLNLKHHGNLPDQITIERHRAVTLAFFDDVTPRLFGIAFGSVSLTHLISDEDTRQHVESAEQAWETGDTRKALTDLRLGFNRLVEGPSRRSTKPAFGLPWDDRKNRQSGLHGIIKWIERLDKDMTSFDHRLTLLSLGIDLHQYESFMAKTPLILYTLTGQADILFNGEPSADQEVFDSCRQFVVDIALRLTPNQAKDEL
jgi:hypothetical protein